MVGLLIPLSGCRQESPSPISIPDPLEIKVVGRDFYWHFVYPGSDLILGTGDDIKVSKDIFVPEGRNVRLIVTSEDYIYFFKAPAYDLREVAIPEMIHEIKFVPSSRGASELEVDPMCSAWAIHKEGSMGNMHTLTEVEFKDWLKTQHQKAKE